MIYIRNTLRMLSEYRKLPGIRHAEHMNIRMVELFVTG